MRAEKITIRINRQINAPRVRLIGAQGEHLGVLTTDEAVKLAEKEGLDLVEKSPKASPPVCQIMDFGKYLYQLSKRKAVAKKKQKQITIKEVKLRPVTEEGDYQVKLRSLIRFLQEGNKAKVTLRYRGREMSHQELGVKVMQRLLGDLMPYGTIELEPRMEGKQLVMVLAPKKSTK